MADSNSINALNATLSSASQQKKTTRGEMGKQEFLQLLVTQLKNQDPLEPIKNEEFAVNLAQFSQLEQLMDINQKIGTDQSGSDFSSLAAYLGHQVTLNTDTVLVESGDAGLAKFKLDEDASGVTLELVNSSGIVAGSFDLPEMPAGPQTVRLNNLDIPNGQYQLRVIANGSNGHRSEPQVQAAGIVSGFIPGPDPVLLIGSREIHTADVTEVNLVHPSM